LRHGAVPEKRQGLADDSWGKHGGAPLPKGWSVRNGERGGGRTEHRKSEIEKTKKEEEEKTKSRPSVVNQLGYTPAGQLRKRYPIGGRQNTRRAQLCQNSLRTEDGGLGGVRIEVYHEGLITESQDKKGPGGQAIKSHLLEENGSRPPKAGVPNGEKSKGISIGHNHR